MTKEKENITGSFYVKEDYGRTISDNKSTTKKSHFLKQGYDFVKLGAAWAKYKGLPPEKIPGEKKDQNHLFGPEQYKNNPDIDLVLQVIAYSDSLKENKDKKDNYLILSDLKKCREKGQEYNNAGFNAIMERIFPKKESDVDIFMADILIEDKLIELDLED